MLSRLMIYLSDEELKALQRVAKDEMRGIREQARFIIHQWLENKGLFSQHNNKVETLSET